jgi:hypothetical protein
MYAITLKHNVEQEQDTGEYRLQIWVHEHTDETDPAIFVYQHKELLPDDISNPDPFSNIASVGDMEEYPKDVPYSTKRPFFRLTYCDLLFRDPELMRRIWTQIKSDVSNLMDNLNKLETITKQETVVV